MGYSRKISLVNRSPLDIALGQVCFNQNTCSRRGSQNIRLNWLERISQGHREPFSWNHNSNQRGNSSSCSIPTYPDITQEGMFKGAFLVMGSMIQSGIVCTLLNFQWSMFLLDIILERNLGLGTCNRQGKEFKLYISSFNISLQACRNRLFSLVSTLNLEGNRSKLLNLQQNT